MGLLRDGRLGNQHVFPHPELRGTKQERGKQLFPRSSIKRDRRRRKQWIILFSASASAKRRTPSNPRSRTSPLIAEKELFQEPFQCITLKISRIRAVITGRYLAPELPSYIPLCAHNLSGVTHPLKHTNLWEPRYKMSVVVTVSFAREHLKWGASLRLLQIIYSGAESPRGVRRLVSPHSEREESLLTKIPFMTLSQEEKRLLPRFLAKSRLRNGMRCLFFAPFRASLWVCCWKSRNGTFFRLSSHDWCSHYFDHGRRSRKLPAREEQIVKTNLCFQFHFFHFFVRELEEIVSAPKYSSKWEEKNLNIFLCRQQFIPGWRALELWNMK